MDIKNYIFTEAGNGFPSVGEFCQVDDGVNDEPEVIRVTKTFGIICEQWKASKMPLQGVPVEEEARDSMRWVTADEH